MEHVKKTTDLAELEVLSYQTRIKLDESEKSVMVDRLNKDVAFVETLFEVDVEGVEPLFNAIELEAKRRVDEVGDTILDVDTIMSLCRKGEYGYIVVPAVAAALESSEHKTS